MTCKTCKYAFDKTTNCSFNISYELRYAEMIRKQLEQTIYIKINPDFIKPLDEQIWNLTERLFEQTTDESIAGCLAKYPLV